jgi:hypothetical protein
MTETTPTTTAIPYGAIITQLLDGNRAHRERLKHSPSMKKYTGPSLKGFFGRSWYEELCTIRVGGGRQSGKTTAAIGFIDNRTAWISHNLPQLESDASHILRVRTDIALPPMLTMYAIDKMMRSEKAPDPKSFGFELSFARYIVDNASVGFDHCPRKRFYDFVSRTAMIDDPEIILIG